MLLCLVVLTTHPSHSQNDSHAFTQGYLTKCHIHELFLKICWFLALLKYSEVYSGYCSCLSLRRSPQLSWFYSRPRQTAVSPSENTPGLLSLSNNGREKSFMENCSTLHNYSTLSATICHPQKSLSDKCLVSLLQYNFNNKGSFQSLSSNCGFVL